MEILPTSQHAILQASWLARKGFQGTINLCKAVVIDLSQALLQSTKAYAFSKGRYHGSGPSTKKLASRVNKGHSMSPQNVERMVSNTVMGTLMQKKKETQIERVAKSVKRKKPSQISTEDQNATHRLDYIFKEVQHSHQRQCQHEEDSIDYSGITIKERKIHRTMWAI